LDHHHAAVFGRPVDLEAALIAMNDLLDLHNKNVLVLGLGASGLAMARWCVKAGAQVTVADTRAAPPQLAALQASTPEAVFVHSDLGVGLLERAAFDWVLSSPGLAPAETSQLRASALEIGIRLGNELSLFASALQHLKTSQNYAPAVIAITGTNGKTTVTALTALLLTSAGKNVALAGNIGPTLLGTLAEKLQELESGTPLPQAWVLELSSFQLSGVEGFEPSAASVLNLSQDHLDWHGNAVDYAQAKARVYGSTGLMVVNRSDSVALAQALDLIAANEPKIKVKNALPRPRLSFGADEPMQPGDYGIQASHGMAWLVRAAPPDETLKRKDVRELHIQRLMPVAALRIAGGHNALNALAALALASSTDAALAPMLHALRDYRGEPHRVQSIAVVDDVEYFDDSKGTNVGATVAAMVGLGGDRKLVVILGGVGKGQDFAPLAEPTRLHARAVVLIGRDAPQIEAVLVNAGAPVLHANSMAHAVHLAAAQARTGDAVLMSPACASFDMFDNYEHRAQAFVQAVQALAEKMPLIPEEGTP
jgi:UDP-N-acetylmuramoylalanine--D-glutamate ligase